MESTRRRVRIVFAEEDTLFRLMEVALLRRLTPGGEKALTYFFGQEFSGPLESLIAISDRLGLPTTVEPVVCSEDKELIEQLPTADFLVVERRPITRDHIQSGADSLQLIQKFGRDYRNIDLAAASEFSIKVANVVRFSSQSSADNVMALILALARNLVKAHQSVIARRDDRANATFREGPPSTKFNWAGISGIRVLAHQTLGFVGFGENSGEVAKRARAFGMRVLYYKRHPLSEEEERELGGAHYCSLDELLGQADFVSMHVPYNQQTDRMVDAEFLGRMKPGAYLVNTARGGVVDEQALYNALKEGRLGAAALDVYRYEPVPSDCPLLDLDNIIWTPHMSGGEPQFMFRDSEDVLVNIARTLNGEAPFGLISPG